MLKVRKTLRTVGIILAGLGILALIGIVGSADTLAQGMGVTMKRSLVAMGVAVIGLLLIIVTENDRL